MKSLRAGYRWIFLSLLSFFFLALAWICVRTYLHDPSRGLPYRDFFAQGKVSEWQALGGLWELADGAMQNDSDERGAKLLTGSPYWHNYSVEADVDLLNVNGDAGLIIRSANEEEGVDSYSGYYAGIRALDNTLVLGRAQHGWREVTGRSQGQEELRPFRWYHLKLLAYDCDIAAVLSLPSGAILTSIAIHDGNCIHSGRVGLRSYTSGGIWRNIVVQQAAHEDLAAILKHTEKTGNPELQSAPAEDAAMSALLPAGKRMWTQGRINSAAQSIASLRTASFATPEIATIRGVVISSAPQLFVEDPTGGVYVPNPSTAPPQIGDEIEVTGEVHPGDFSPTLEHASVKVLWARTPVPPVSTTAFQASTGKFDASFVELQGRLVAKKRGPNNTLILDLDDGAQSFRALMSSGWSDELFSSLEPGSSLRLRGVCVTSSAFTNNLTPFVLLLRSSEDLTVLAGPPWWTIGHLLAVAGVLLAFALIANTLYHRVVYWHLQAVLEERRRLAYEMHDTLAQSFAGIGFQLEAIRNRLPNEMHTLHQQLNLASELIRHSHEEARRSITPRLHESLESGDLLAALDSCAQNMVNGGSMQVVSRRDGNVRPIPLRIADPLFRIGQEAIANVIRHAGAARLTIGLAYRDNAVSLSIEDDGVGFVQENCKQGFGIRGMGKRARSISANFELHSAPGQGTHVQVRAGLPPRATLASLPKLFLRLINEYSDYGRRA